MTTFYKGRKAILGLAAIIGLTAASASSNATVLINFSTIWTSSGTPGGPAPWATLAIDNDGANQVKLTLTHSATSAAGQFLTTLLLFADPLPGDAAAVLPLDPLVDAVSFGTGNDSGLTYNVDVSIDNAPPADRMMPGMSAIIKLSGTGLTEDDFAVMPGSDDCLALLHLQGIEGGGSAKLCGEVVPEPSSLLAIGAGLAGLLALRRRK